MFVYGTLACRLPKQAHPLLHGRARLVGTASLAGTLYRVSDYPGARPHFGKRWQRVYGFLYCLAPLRQTLALLDDYEECSAAFPPPHEYRRLNHPFANRNQRTVHAYVYWYNHDLEDANRQRINHGRWPMTSTHFFRQRALKRSFGRFHC